MDTIRNVTQLQIGAKVALTVIADGVLITNYSQLNDGEIVLVDHLNAKTDGSTTTPHLVKFIQRSGTLLIHSDLIDLRNGVKTYLITSGADETQQTDYVGSNGVTGSITGVASNIYTIRLNILDKTTAGFMQQKIKEGFYKSNANTTSYTQWAIAEGLVNSLIANYSRETEQDITFGVINSGARVALGTGAGTVTFTKGSKYAVFGTAIDDATANPILLVGDLLAAAVGVTVMTYRVVAIDVPTETCELDHVYQGPTVTVANAAVGRVVGATAQAADYGVKMQGVNREFKAGYYWSNVCFWETQIDFGDLAGEVLLTSTAAYPGIGTGDYVANLEGELQADEFIYRGFPEAGVVNRTDAEASHLGIYDLMVVEHKHTLSAAQGTPTESEKALEIAWRISTNLVADDVADIFELLLTAAGVPYTSQVGNIT